MGKTTNKVKAKITWSYRPAYAKTTIVIVNDKYVFTKRLKGSGGEGYEYVKCNTVGDVIYEIDNSTYDFGWAVDSQLQKVVKYLYRNGYLNYDTSVYTKETIKKYIS